MRDTAAEGSMLQLSFIIRSSSTTVRQNGGGDTGHEEASMRLQCFICAMTRVVAYRQTNMRCSRQETNISNHVS